MAEELTVSVAAEYEDAVGIHAGPVEISNLLITLATAKVLHTKQSIGTSAEAIELGDITNVGLCIFVNRDPTNYIQIKQATGETTYHAKLFPSGSIAGINFCIYHAGDGAQAPFAIANAASCEMEIFICSL